MRHVQFFACASALIAASACSTSSDTPQPVITTPPAEAASLNSSLASISLGHTSNGGAVDEVFPAISASLTVESSGPGDIYVAQSQESFENPGAISYDAASNTVTFDIVQGDIAIQEAFGPILLSNPGDLPNLQNDMLAVMLASFPQWFPTPESLGFTDIDFNPADFLGNPQAADAAILALQELAGDDGTGGTGGGLGGLVGGGGGEPTNSAGAYLAALNATASSEAGRDFFNFTGSDGTSYGQLKLSGTNSEIDTNYVTLGIWRTTPADGFDGDDAYGATVWGQPTPENEVPETGTATYTSTIVGFVLRQNDVSEMRGDVQLNVNFGQSTVGAAVNPSYIVDGPDGIQFVDLPTLAGEGFLETGNRFDGPLQGTNDPTLRGKFEGAFFGPFATEVGGSLTFSNDSLAGSGAFAGTRNDQN
ncbi:MAG: transferrin-binding protein-like solute binding protein [Pseudomonadota bacterium]